MELRKKVEVMLRDYPETRDSDKELCLKLWENYYGADRYNSMLVEIFKLPSQESIGRIRRKFQENGKYLPTDEKVAQKRKERQTEYKKEYGHGQTLAEVARMEYEYKQATREQEDNRIRLFN